MTNKEAIMILESVQPSCEKYSYSESEIYEAIDMAISALAERKKGKGKWILGGVETGAFNMQYQWKKCSECGWASSLVIPRNFCPNCGADMRERKTKWRNTELNVL